MKYILFILVILVLSCKKEPNTNLFPIHVNHIDTSSYYNNGQNIGKIDIPFGVDVFTPGLMANGYAEGIKINTKWRASAWAEYLIKGDTSNFSLTLITISTQNELRELINLWDIPLKIGTYKVEEKFPEQLNSEVNGNYGKFEDDGCIIGARYLFNPEFINYSFVQVDTIEKKNNKIFISGCLNLFFERQYEYKNQKNNPDKVRFKYVNFKVELIK